MKKTNKKGFTLVELVVVVAIFGIILGTILNFIKPANNLHNDVQATMDANIISSGVVEYMDDELRYATNVLVLQNYAGVPKVSATGQVGTCPIPFTSCLILDNKNFRGYSLSDYSGSDNDTAAKRMGATGCVIKVNQLDQGGLHLKNSRVAKGVAFYDNFKFDIQCGSNLNEVKRDPSLKTLQVNIVTYQAEYRNGSYVFEKKKFDRDTVYSADEDKQKSSGAIINLTNINIEKGGSFDLRGCIPCDDTVFDSYIAKNYPAATAPAGSTTYQSSYYSTADDNRYTYIFYQKKSGASASKCEVKMVYSNDHPTASLQGKQIGSSQYVTKGATFKSFSSAPTISGYNPPKWLAPDGSVVDTSKGYVINEDTIFTLVYEPEEEVQTYTVTWYEPDGTTVFTTNNAFENHAPYSPGTPIQYDDTKQDVVGWFRLGTGEEYSTVKITNNSFKFVAKVKNKCKVEFTSDEAGENIVASMTNYVSEGNKAFIPTEVPTPPADKQFDKWVVKGKDPADASYSIENYTLTSDTIFVPVFKDKPPIPAGSTVVKVHVIDVLGWNNELEVYMDGGTADFSVGGYVSVARQKANKYNNFLSGMIKAGKTYEITFYSSKVTVGLQWSDSREMPNDGNIYEYWYKGGKLFTFDPS